MWQVFPLVHFILILVFFTNMLNSTRSFSRHESDTKSLNIKQMESLSINNLFYLKDLGSYEFYFVVIQIV